MRGNRETLRIDRQKTLVRSEDNRKKRRAMPEPIVKSPISARSATKDGVGRYVLASSLAIVIVLCAIGFVVVRYVI